MCRISGTSSVVPTDSITQTMLEVARDKTMQAAGAPALVAANISAAAIQVVKRCLNLPRHGFTQIVTVSLDRCERRAARAEGLPGLPRRAW